MAVVAKGKDADRPPYSGNEFLVLYPDFTCGLVMPRCFWSATISMDEDKAEDEISRAVTILCEHAGRLRGNSLNVRTRLRDPDELEIEVHHVNPLRDLTVLSLS